MRVFDGDLCTLDSGWNTCTILISWVPQICWYWDLVKVHACRESTCFLCNFSLVFMSKANPDLIQQCHVKSLWLFIQHTALNEVYCDINGLLCPALSVQSWHWWRSVFCRHFHPWHNLIYKNTWQIRIKFYLKPDIYNTQVWSKKLNSWIHHSR